MQVEEIVFVYENKKKLKIRLNLVEKNGVSHVDSTSAMLAEKFKMMETESDVFHGLRLDPYESCRTVPQILHIYLQILEAIRIIITIMIHHQHHDQEMLQK